MINIHTWRQAGLATRLLIGCHVTQVILRSSFSGMNSSSGAILLSKWFSYIVPCLGGAYIVCSTVIVVRSTGRMIDPS